ncbi:hypothetical protein WSM22_30920 [Cytophagales bacterium WSM2-2]|nr:hypothetical protein WSM22_30920 [Cytophagales bacterium WSM2-2]
MRRLINIGFLILISCGTRNEKAGYSYYVEKRLSFYDPYDPAFTTGTWIRKPENIRIAHETFKKFGYLNLFSASQLNDAPCWIPGLDGGVRDKTCKNIIDSLILTYRTIETADKYYREFWLRRKAEGNDSMVFEILKELKGGLFGKSRLTFDRKLVNDTMINLIKIRQGPVDDKTSIQYFDYLKSIGLHASAYNLLYEWTRYEEVKWDREKLKQGLKKDTIKCCPIPIIEDDSK